MAPKPPPRAPKTSPSLDFHRFWVDFGRFFDDFLYHVGYFLSGLPHYFFGYLELSFSNFWPQVQMCWGRPQGSVRSQKSAMWPTFCLACLFVFVTSSPTSQVSGHRFLVDFGRFFDDFLYHVGYFLSGLPHYFFGYLEVSFSNFWPQVQMCWGRTQGSAR